MEYHNKWKLSLVEASEHPLGQTAVTNALVHYGTDEFFVKPLAQGGQGIVFFIQNRYGSAVLLKVPSYGTRSQAEYWLLEHGLAKESAILSELKCNVVPSLIKCDDSGQYLFREFVDGIRLSELIVSDDTKSPLLKSLFYTAQNLFSAFHYSKRGCYVIRDFKPANLIVDPNCLTMKLIDVGSARPETDMLSKTSRPYRLGSGKWLYWAPEQLMEKVEWLNRKADYFSVAATAFFIITGKAPYDNLENNHEKAMAGYLSQYQDVRGLLSSEGRKLKVPNELLNFLQRCLNPISQERPSTIDVQTWQW